MANDRGTVGINSLHSAGVHATFGAVCNRTDCEGAATDAEALGNVFACAHADGAKLDDVARVAMEDGVGNLVDRAIPATGDEPRAA